MNVVLIIVDSLQKSYVGAYGNKWIKTPYMDKLAKGSCVFTNAYPESLPTLQVRIAVHSGRKVYPFRENVLRKGDKILQPGWGPIPEEWVTVSEILCFKGYRTGLITDTLHQFRPGRNFHRGFDQFTFIRGQEDDSYISGCPPGMKKTEDYYITLPGQKDQKSFDRSLLNLNNVRLKVHSDYFKNTAHRKAEEDYFAPQVFREAVKWLYQNQDAEKFYLVVDSFDPHEPWDPPTYYRKMYDPNDDMNKDIIFSTYSSSSLLTERQLRRLRANYAGEITMVDRWLGCFLDSLDYMGIREDTWVILLSDHGHHLGEKNLVGKFPYPILPEVADLVLFIRDPEGRYAGREVDEFVYDIDVTPTILSILGIKPPEEMEGINLIPVIEGKEHTGRNHVTSGWQNNVMVKTEKFWYTGRLNRSEELLFSLKHDPQFENNVAPQKNDVCRKMHEYALEDAEGDIPEYIKRWPKYNVYGGTKW